MSHLAKAIFWLATSLLMLFCCVVAVMEQKWLVLILPSITFVLDILNAFTEFSAWARELGWKDAQKNKNENNT